MTKRKRLLELFSGTGSVGKVATEMGYEVISLDIDGRATINIDILKWDYTVYERGYFHTIWASPPCQSFSQARVCNIGRPIKSLGGRVCTHELLKEDMYKRGLPLVLRMLEIITYFNPTFWFIENPANGKMKNFLYLPYYDVSYCHYSNYGYRKNTRIWCNKLNFIPKYCKRDCNNLDDKKNHTGNIMNTGTLEERYRIPPKLIQELLINNN